MSSSKVKPKNPKRYRVGIDVGLYSVGLAAIEIDDAECVYDAMPVSILNAQSVIHDGAIDPDNAKSADSRKAVSGVARRIRRLRKQTHKRLKKLDDTLTEYGFPVMTEDELTTISAQMQDNGKSDSYFAWHARIAATQSYISNDKERMLAVSVALRHIARHRGWRNSYSSVQSLYELAKEPSDFYKEFYKKIKGIEFSEAIDVSNRPTVAELVEPFLDTNAALRRFSYVKSGNARIEVGTGDKKHYETSAIQLGIQIAKLHQSDNLFEILKIFDMQKIYDENMRKDLIEGQIDTKTGKRIGGVFDAINPKDVGAAAQLVGFDDLAKQENHKYRRATKASIAFQKYNIVSTIKNLRMKDVGALRELTKDETQKLYEYLCCANPEEITWGDVAETLGITRGELKGVGGQTADGEPISVKKPPTLETDYAIMHANGIKKELKALYEWWPTADDDSKEWFIETLSNAGAPKAQTNAERAAKSSVDDLYNELGELSEEAIGKLDNIKLASGRAAYSVDTLQRLTKRMLDGNVDLHEARKSEFGVKDDWHPKPNTLGTPTGNPAVDRTIKIVARWLKACEREWGAPVTVSVEHVREGFMTEKAKRRLNKDLDKRYDTRKETKEAMIDELGLTHDPRPEEVRKWRALQRQNCQCLYCGAPITYATAEMDHIVPRKGIGSTNRQENFAAVCRDCNMGKTNIPFARWAKETSGEGVSLSGALERVDQWDIEAKYFNNKQWKKFVKAVKERLRQYDEDDAIDARSMESVAWMALELRDQISGYFNFDYMQRKADASEVEIDGKVYKLDVDTGELTDKSQVEAVEVYRGSITAMARKASGLEGRMHWIGGGDRKNRLDRRHHAIDASTIALLRPGVAKTLIERDAKRREMQDLGLNHEQWETRKPEWKRYIGQDGAQSKLYLHWKDEQMKMLIDMLNSALDNDEVVVTRPVRLRLGVGRAHEDTIAPMLKRKVSDKLTPINIDKAESPALWCALTQHPDYDPKEGLLPDNNRRIRVNGAELGPYDDIGFLCEDCDSFESPISKVCMPVRGGFAQIGVIHHARFYRIPKIQSGNQTGYEFAYMRVFQPDLMRALKIERKVAKQNGRLPNLNLYQIDIPPESISRRAAVKNLKWALDNDLAEYLGWAVVDDELRIDDSNKYFSPEGSQKLNKFMKAFPHTKNFRFVGFDTNARLKIAPMEISAEELEKVKDTIEDYAEIKSVIDGKTPLAVKGLLDTNPEIIRRNALGQERWQSNNHMPCSWKVTPHPEI